MLTMIAVNSSSLVQILLEWSFGRSLIRRWIFRFQIFQHTCYQYWSWPTPLPIPQLVEASCQMLALGTRSTKLLSSLIHCLVQFRCSMRCAWRYSSSLWIGNVSQWSNLHYQTAFQMEVLGQSGRAKLFAFGSSHCSSYLANNSAKCKVLARRR